MLGVTVLKTSVQNKNQANLEKFQSKRSVQLYQHSHEKTHSKYRLNSALVVVGSRCCYRRADKFLLITKPRYGF